MSYQLVLYTLIEQLYYQALSQSLALQKSTGIDTYKNTEITENFSEVSVSSVVQMEYRSFFTYRGTLISVSAAQ